MAHLARNEGRVRRDCGEGQYQQQPNQMIVPVNRQLELDISKWLETSVSQGYSLSREHSSALVDQLRCSRVVGGTRTSGPVQ